MRRDLGVPHGKEAGRLHMRALLVLRVLGSTCVQLAHGLLFEKAGEVPHSRAHLAWAARLCVSTGRRDSRG